MHQSGRRMAIFFAVQPCGQVMARVGLTFQKPFTPAFIANHERRDPRRHYML
jgi:hypothetical protein